MTIAEKERHMYRNTCSAGAAAMRMVCMNKERNCKSQACVEVATKQRDW